MDAITFSTFYTCIYILKLQFDKNWSRAGTVSLTSCKSRTNHHISKTDFPIRNSCSQPVYHITIISSWHIWPRHRMFDCRELSDPYVISHWIHAEICPMLNFHQHQCWQVADNPDPQASVQISQVKRLWLVINSPSIQRLKYYHKRISWTGCDMVANCDLSMNWTISEYFLTEFEIVLQATWQTVLRTMKSSCICSICRNVKNSFHLNTGYQYRKA